MAINLYNNRNFTDQRILQEGKPYNFIFEQVYSNATITNATITSFFVNIGKFLLLDEIVIASTSDTVIMATAQVAATANPANLDQTANNIIGVRSSDTTQIDLRDYTSAKRAFVRTKQRMYDRTTMIIGTRDTAVTGFTGRIAINATGILFDADTNWDAKFTILGAGDSILSALNGGTSYTDSMMYFTRIRDYYKYNKTVTVGDTSTFYAAQDVRKVNKAEGGRTSSNGETWRDAGFYMLQSIEMSVYNFMVNDAGASPFLQANRDTFKSNLRAFINWHQSIARRKPILICTGTPVTDNTLEGNLVLLRQDARDVVLEYGESAGEGSDLTVPNPLSVVVNTDNGKIILVDCGTAFNRTDIQFYNNSLGNGDGLHPNAIRGHAAIFNNCIKPALDAWLPKLT